MLQAPQRLLVTGAGGFVGAAVVHEAVLAGHHVVATIRPGADAARLQDIDSPLLQIAPIDLRDGDGIAAMLRRHRPQAIIHVAWSGVASRARNERSQITDNIETACRLVEAGVAAGMAKFVGLGSQAEYGPVGRKVGEDDLPRPTTLYGAAKLAALHLTGQLAAQAGASFAWLRLFSTYGPGDNPHWLIPSLIDTMLSGTRPKTTLGTQLWDCLYIDDVARGILAAATTPAASGVFNLGSGQPVAVRAIVEAIRDLAAPDMELVFGEVPYRPDQVWHMEADIARLTAATGWRPEVGLEPGLAATVAWHRASRTRQERTESSAASGSAVAADLGLRVAVGGPR